MKKHIVEIAKSKDFVYHGSPFLIEKLEPRQAKTRDKKTGEMVNDGKPAVVATNDLNIAIFRALTAKLRGSTAFSISDDTKDPKRFMMSKEAKKEYPKSKGYVYVLGKKYFKKHTSLEWRAYKEITPLKRLEVNPKDFTEKIFEIPENKSSIKKALDQKNADRIITECQDFFGVKIKNIPKITFIYSREEMDELLGRKTEPWVRAVTRPSGLYFIHPSKIAELTPHKKDDYWQAVKHEMSHWFYNQITGTHNGEPRWFAEGLAMYMAGQKTLLPTPTEESVTTKYYACTDNEVYRWGSFMVVNLAENYGKEKIVSLVRKINSKTTPESFATDFKNEFGICLEAFEENIKRAVKKT